LPAPDSPAASASSSESGPEEVNPDILALQQECDLVRGRFSAASVEIEHLRDSLRVVEVARSAAEEEVRAARDAAANAQARAFGEF
jgi:septation ring formation regulator EzrA